MVRPEADGSQDNDVTRALATVVAAVALVAAGFAQVDIAKLGPQVGDRAIDFQLTDQSGRTQRLATIAGPKGTMLVFVRSADW
jgi:hypothetical protein